MDHETGLYSKIGYYLTLKLLDRVWMNEWMKYLITKFIFQIYNHKREQNTNKNTNLVTGSNKIARLVKAGPKFTNH